VSKVAGFKSESRPAALKMIAYVSIAPIAGAFAGRLPRRGFLVVLDFARAGFVLLLPFVTEVWQIYVLVFVFQSFSAAFTPTFQATIPDILSDERDYTRALSLSRLAYDLEALLSPMLAAALLAFMTFHWLFVGTMFGFLASATLVLSVGLPVARVAADVESGFLSRLTRGTRIYLRTPRLRGLLALTLAVAAASAMVIVNTVVLVRDVFGGSEQDVAIFLAAYGAGSMLVALVLPRLLDHLPDRPVMLAGAVALFPGLLMASTMPGMPTLLAIWFALGMGAALIQTPAGRLLRRSSRKEDRPALFASQFALTHCWWLLTYPLAGYVGAYWGMPIAFIVMGTLAAAGGAFALALWPKGDRAVLEHSHPELKHDHLHVHDEHHQHAHEGWEGPQPHRHPHLHPPIRHAHAFVIDDHHPIWPHR
jgi:MFS family permease